MPYEVQSFEEEVIQASHLKPVLVDFWAPWCGPCRTLGPVLEKLAHESAESWTLVKINSDNHQDLSARYGIQGIPAVKLFSRGEIIDEFTGVLPENAIRQWLEKALPSPMKDLLREAEHLLEMGDRKKAEDLLERVLSVEPTNPTASGLLAGLIVFKDAERADLLARTAATGEPRFMQLGSAIETIASVMSRDDIESEIAEAKAAAIYVDAIDALRSGDINRTLEGLIEVLKLNRYLDDDGARKLGVALFTVLGTTHEITSTHRRTFDMWLY